MAKLDVFISYAHKDADYFTVFSEGLKTHLYTSSKYDFGTWDDSKIHVGSFWDNEIQQNLKGAGIAVLCVSGNFLNSKYIKEEEFKKLRQKNSTALIFPVYFNHCQMEAWQDLAAIQFFKPHGSKYEKPNNNDFAFCDLVKFTETNKEYIPNSNIELYIMNFVRQIEDALENGSILPTGNIALKEYTAPPDSTINTFIKKPGNTISLEKIVTIIIIAAIAASLLLIFYFLFKQDIGSKFRVNVSLGMFFGSLAAFMFNKKNVQLNRQ